MTHQVRETKKDKRALVAAGSYLVFFLPRFTEYKSDSEVRFHAKQGLGLLVFALTLQGIISVLGYWGFPAWRVWPVRLVLLYLLFIGIRNAWQGKREVLPWIGEYAENAF